MGECPFTVTDNIGKTSVYIKLISEMRRQNKSSIIMVPEIGLTPQFIGILSSHFGDDIAVLHSSLSMGERFDEWKRIKNGANFLLNIVLLLSLP